MNVVIYAVYPDRLQLSYIGRFESIRSRHAGLKQITRALRLKLEAGEDVIVGDLLDTDKPCFTVRPKTYLMVHRPD